MSEQNDLKDLDLLEEREDVILLIDEEGAEIIFQLVGDFTFEGQDYAVLSDRVADEGDDISEEANLMVYKIIDEDGEDVLVEIEDDNEWNRVVDFWNNLED